MASFYYYYQNPSGFRFLVQIRAFVTQTWEYQILKNIKERDEMNSGLR